MTLTERVAALAGDNDPGLVAESVEILTAMARVHTRGNGFGVEGPEPDVAAVIVTAAARLAANPDQVDSGVGEVWVRGGFKGFTLAELVVLNARRKTSR